MAQSATSQPADSGAWLGKSQRDSRNATTLQHFTVAFARSWIRKNSDGYVDQLNSCESSYRAGCNRLRWTLVRDYLDLYGSLPSFKSWPMVFSSFFLIFIFSALVKNASMDLASLQFFFGTSFSKTLP